MTAIGRVAREYGGKTEQHGGRADTMHENNEAFGGEEEEERRIDRGEKWELWIEFQTLWVLRTEHD